MKSCVSAILLTGLWSLSQVQTQTQSPSSTPKPTTTVLPKERGLIMAVYHDYGDPDAAQLRHLPMYPGFENFSGSLPGIRFNNPYIQFLSVDVDTRTRTVYLYDYYLRAIAVGTGYNSMMNLSQLEFSFMHLGVSRGSIQIAVDWLSHTVYWTDAVFRWIVAAPGQKSKIQQDYYKMIVDDHLEAPDGLAIDPLEGYLFWSDNGKHPKIERSDLMGKNRHTIITQNLQSPLSMDVDIVEKRIYWIDSLTESVLSAKYDGSDMTMIKRVTGSILLDIDSFRDVLYLTDIKNSDLLTINKTGGKMEATVINISPETIYSIAVYGEEKQPLKDKDYCAALNCSHLCISTKTGAVCQCSDGYTYNTTTGLCDESYAALHKAVVYANTTHICLVDIRTFAHFAYEPVCVYTAYKPMTTVPPPTPVRRRRRQVPSTNTTSSPMPTKSTSQTPPTPPTPPPSKPPPIVSPLDFIKMFDLNMANRVVFFVNTDNVIYSRPLDLPIENDAKLLITRASGNISGLAFDPVNGYNLFWCESDTGNIYLVNVRDFSVRKVTPSGTVSLVKPKNLLVLLEQRKLAWISSVSGSTAIQTMNFDGSDYAVVATASGMTSLVADKEKKVFYYTVPSTGRVYEVSFDGKTGPTALSISLDNTAYLFVHYNNYFAWVYSSPGYGYLVVTNDYALNRQIGRGYFENKTALVDMKVLDPELQTIDKISPCAYENGNCQHICITKYTNNVMTKVCECNMGYQLADDKTSCKSSGVVKDNFLLVADWTYDMLHQIDLSTGDFHAISLPEAESFEGVFYDRITQKVVWSQNYDTRIYSATLDGTDVKILADLDYSYPYRFAKDETTGNLYYTSYFWQHIGLITPDLTNIWLNEDFYSEDLGDIVVHPGKGWLFYTVSDYDESYVVRSNMDGTINTKIITAEGYADGLAIDYRNDRLYWSDSTYDTIEGCNFDGKNCTTIVNISSLQAEEIRDLAINGDYLYYSAYKKDHVVRVSLKPPYNREQLGNGTGGFGKLDTISLYNSANTNKQPVSEACRDRNGKGDCSTVCIPTSQGRTCMCEDGVHLRPDGRTCEDVHQCTDVIVQQGTNNEDVKITFKSSCLRHKGDTCDYFCPANYVPVNRNSTMLTCTSIGWDRETLKLCEAVRCPTSIENGVLSPSCKLQVGEICDFTCNPGYIKTENNTFCTQNGTFHKNSKDFCALYTCPDTISHGSLYNCPRTVGSTCTVTCDKYYTPSTDSATIKCVLGGWNTNLATFCKASQCTDSSLMNGQVTGSCSRGPGDVCQYTCNSGYYNSTAMVVCNSDMNWHPPDACGLNMCPIAIVNGRVRGDCSRQPNSVCGYSCNMGFNSSHLVFNISCLISGQWNQTDNLCIGGANSVTAAPLRTGPEGISKGGVVAGIIILVIIVIALAAVIVFLVRRGMSRSHAATYGNATFTNGGNVQIENPGYISGPAAGSRHNDEPPYSSVDPSQMQPVSFAEGYATADNGIVNPMYNREPLSDVAQVQISQDKEVLTHDSWLREQERMGKP